jgi:hypothetical protein
MNQAQGAAPILASSVAKLRTLGAQLYLVDPLQVLARAHAALGDLDAALSARFLADFTDPKAIELRNRAAELGSD